MMSRGTLNLLLLVLFLSSLGVNWAAHPRPWQPNREFMPEMVRTPRYNAYAANPNFPDGKTLQTPVAGTIPRGAVPLHFTATPKDAVRAGEELHSPYQDNSSSMGGTMCCGAMDARTSKAVERGATVFANFCQPCHGPSGKGDGLVVAKGYPAPPSLYADNARNIKDGQMFHILAFGQKNMPSYAAQISRDDRWNVIAYIRSLQAQPPATTPAAAAVPAPATASASAPATGGRP
jgi:mono/diheme cytochrome c family protein